MDLSKKWMRDYSNVKDIHKAVVEEFINSLPNNICVWIKERKPTTSLEAGQLAHNYFQAWGTTSRVSIIKPQAKGPLSETPVPASSTSDVLMDQMAALWNT